MGNLCGTKQKQPDAVCSEILADKKGTGDSGKSTFFKQVNFLYDGALVLNGEHGAQAEHGFDSFTSAIYANILETLQSLLKSMEEYNAKHDEKLVFKDEMNYERAKKIKSLDANLRTATRDYNAETALDAEALWNEDALQSLFDTRYNYHVFDGAPHFFKEHELSKFRPPNYKPDFNDVLYCRRKTTGVVEARVTFPDLRLLFIDVGGMHLNILTVSGQRSERKKWVNLFGGLEGLIFVVSLSEFDQLCYEDEQTNRMQESLDLFDETINNSSFAQLPVIVFFNKLDLFAEKLKTKDIKIAFPDYQGDQTVEACSEFIKQKFLAKNKHDPNRVQCTFTSATNSDMVKDSIEMVKNTLSKQRPSKETK